MFPFNIVKYGFVCRSEAEIRPSFISGSENNNTFSRGAGLKVQLVADEKLY